LRTLEAPLGTADLGTLLDTLAQRDLALLTSGWAMGPSQPSQRLIRAALARGFRVLAVPGPAFPIVALVISGLPTDSFVFLNSLPEDADARHGLLQSVSGERRTLVLLGTLARLPELYDALGERDVTLVASLEERIQIMWQGPLSSAIAEFAASAPERHYALVVGGAPEASRWEEARIRQQVQALLDRGLGAKAISQQLAAESGWPRREIYRLALAAGKTGQIPG
jgi:16S rRNA (cytidine1402-2'-O)-methyltransferase